MDSRAGPGALSSLVVIRVYLSFFFPLSFLSSSLWLCQVLVATHGISSCCMRTLSRDVWDLVSPDQAPCIGSAVSQPLDRQERSQHPCSLITPSLRPSFPGGSDDKESACDTGNERSIPGSGRCPGGGNGNPLQYSCLENPMERGAWRAAVHGVVKSQTPLRE